MGGQFGEALGLLRPAASADRAADRDEHRRALALTARLFRHAGPADAERAAVLLAEQAAPGAPDRPWALRALAVLQAGRGQHAAALATADALVADVAQRAGGTTAAERSADAAFAQTYRALALVALGRTAEVDAALAAAEAAQPGGADVALARQEIAMRLGRSAVRTPRRASEPAGGAQPTAARAAESSGAEDDGEPVLALGSVYPNPAQGTATVPLALDVLAEVRLAAYDVLGREVAIVYDGSLAAGEHALAFDAWALPPGVYLLRAEVRRDAGARVLTRRVTVAR